MKQRGTRRAVCGLWALGLLFSAVTACGAADGTDGTDGTDETDETDETVEDEPAEEVGVATDALGGFTPVGTVSRSFGQVSYDATNAYFTHGASIDCATTSLVRKMNLSSGALSTLSSGDCTRPGQSASNGTTLFYIDSANRDIRRVAVAGGADTKYLDIGTNFFSNGLYAASNHILWGDIPGLHLATAPNNQALMVASSHPEGIELLGNDGSHWYYQTCHPSGCLTGYTLWRAAIFSSPELLATQLGSTTHAFDFKPFAFDSTHVYWGTILSSGDHRLRRLQKSDLTLGSLRTTSAYINSIAANEGYVYWAEGNAIMRYRKSTNTVSTQVQPAVTPTNLRVSSAHLFWTEDNARQLWRATLP